MHSVHRSTVAVSKFENSNRYDDYTQRTLTHQRYPLPPADFSCITDIEVQGHFRAIYHALHRDQEWTVLNAAGECLALLKQAAEKFAFA